MTTEIKIEDVTNVGGQGTFDLMVSELGKHLAAERTAGRITGQEYTNAYVQLMTAALQQSLSFELQKYQAAAQADLTREQLKLVTAQITQTGAETSRINATTSLIQQQRETEVNQTAQVAAQTSLITAQKALADQQLLKGATELLILDQELLKTQQEVLILTGQKLLTDQQLVKGAKDLLQQDADLAKTTAETAVAAKQLLLMQSQIDGQTKQNLRTDEEILFTRAKTDSEKATYSDSVSTGAVAGVIGKQKLLLTAQAEGFDKNIKLGKAKAGMEVFSVMRTTDPDAVDPSGYGLGPSSIAAMVAAV